MMHIEFKRLTEVEKSDIIELMNNHLVRRQMPLLTGDFSERVCDRFITAKEQLWIEYGYGPWAFIVNGQFAGWGGLQPENAEPDQALVLYPDYRGISTGKSFYNKIKSVTVLFPPTRTRIKGLLRPGFNKDSEIEVGHAVKGISRIVLY